MSPFDPRKTSHRSAATESPPAPKQIVTTTGVTVIVTPPPPSKAPPPKPPPPEPLGPRAIVIPEGLSPKDREAFLDALCREYRDVIEKMIARYRDILPASAEDFRQRVWIILCEKVKKEEPIDDGEGWLAGVVRKETWHRWRKKARSPDVDPDAEVTDDLGIADDHEQSAEIAEQLEVIDRCLALLPPKEREVFQLSEFEGMTIEAIAQQLGRPRSTVGHQIDRAWKNLKELVERARSAE